MSQSLQFPSKRRRRRCEAIWTGESKRRSAQFHILRNDSNIRRRQSRRALVLTRGVEPPRVSPYGPEPYASAIPPRERRAKRPLKCARPSRPQVAIIPAVFCAPAPRSRKPCGPCLTNAGDRHSSRRRSRSLPAGSQKAAPTRLTTAGKVPPLP